jgi:hypothetical protein
MKKLHTEIEINATPEKVWDVLTDFASYAEWNPFVTSAAGKAAVGERLQVRMNPPGGRAATFRPTVTEAQAPMRLEWLGKLLFKGLFDGRHRFQIGATSGGTNFIQSEEFTGVLVPLLARSLDGPTREGFELMNRAIKERAEDG